MPFVILKYVVHPLRHLVSDPTGPRLGLSSLEVNQGILVIGITVMSPLPRLKELRNGGSVQIAVETDIDCQCYIQLAVMDYSKMFGVAFLLANQF